MSQNQQGAAEAALKANTQHEMFRLEKNSPKSVICFFLKKLERGGKFKGKKKKTQIPRKQEETNQ